MATSYRDDPRWIKAKYAGRDFYGNPFNAGTMILYYPRTKKIFTGEKAEQEWRFFESARFDEAVYNRDTY
jgi:hypothetical protein